MQQESTQFQLGNSDLLNEIINETMVNWDWGEGGRGGGGRGELKWIETYSIINLDPGLFLYKKRRNKMRK